MPFESPVPALLALDGCRGGWCGALWRHGEPDRVSCRVFATLAEAWEMIAEEPGSELAVDMPIGLSGADGPDRLCDREARRLLGKGLGSRVFPAPARAALFANTHAEALRLNLAATGKGLSAQAFHLLPKIREVDAFIAAFPLAPIREVHPELSFMRLNGGRPVASKKKQRAGAQERRALLQAQVPSWMERLDAAIANTPKRVAKADDWLDAAAIAAAWVSGGRRWCDVCPAPLLRDAFGRPMQIAY